MKYSKNVNLFIIFFILFIATPSSTKSFEGSKLLTSDDLAHEAADRQNGPALESAINDPKPWATYNQWMCFDTNQVQLESIGVKYDSKWKQMPQITITTLGQHFELSPSVELRFNSREILKNWGDLVSHSQEICLYAAFLQYLDTDENKVPNSLWVLEDIKTEAGYWHVNEFTRVN